MKPFEPFEGRGTPLEEQYRSWSAIVKKPYDKRSVDAYSRTRGILMNGIENGVLLHMHALARSADGEDKNLLAELRRVEEQQQTTIDWSIPADQTVIETTLAFEQLATDLTANLARNESDPYIKQALDFALIEDFDHLYRYSFLYDSIENGDPDTILQGNTDVKPGRPTADEHRHPVDDANRWHYEKETAEFKTKMNVWTIVLAEQQTYLYYKTHGMMYSQDIARKLYAEIAEIEEEHVTHYEALGDPSETWLERLLLLQAVEAYNYWSCLQTETDPHLKNVWEEFYQYELEHIKLISQAMEKRERRSAEEVLPDRLENLVVLEPNKEYVDEVIKSQVNLRPHEGRFIDLSELPRSWRSFDYARKVNEGGAPSDSLEERRGKAA